MERAHLAGTCLIETTAVLVIPVIVFGVYWAPLEQFAQQSLRLVAGVWLSPPIRKTSSQVASEAPSGLALQQTFAATGIPAARERPSEEREREDQQRVVIVDRRGPIFVVA
jgi:hypothetical protein